MPFIETSSTPSTRLFYQDVGSGWPVVLVHCWPLSHRAWEPQINALVDAGYRPIAYDRRGFGDSDKPAGGYDYDTLATDLHDLILALDLHDAVIVGHSMGGGEVARYVGRFGTDRISKAIFVGSVPPFWLKTDDNPDGLDAEVFDGLLAAVKRDRIGFLDAWAAAFFGLQANPSAASEDMVRYAKAIAWSASPIAMQRCIPAFGTTDFRSDLASITVPTLIVHGAADVNVPLEPSARSIAALVPNCRLEVIAGAPHGLTFTHADQLNALMLDFLGS